jgi:thioredoxin-related protein
MERMLATDEVGEFMNSRFVSVRYDVDQATGALLAQTNGVRSIPTCLVLNAKGEVVGRLVGLSSAEKFIASMRRLLANIPAEE